MLRWKSILVVGCGRFGASLAGMLSNQGHNVIIIDKDRGSFRKLPGNFSGFQMEGDAADVRSERVSNIDILR